MHGGTHSPRSQGLSSSKKRDPVNGWVHEDTVIIDNLYLNTILL